MILLSETSTNKYYGIQVPIDSINHIITFFYLAYKDRFGNHLISFNQQLFDPTILGIIGPEDSIPEEVAEEIVEYIVSDNNEKTYLYKDYVNIPYFIDSPILSIKSLIKSKEILIENPIKKPDRNNKEYNHGYHTQSDWFERDLKEWQSYESKLKKVVIIKTEK